MFARRKLKKRIKEALQNWSLQKALEKASFNHFLNFNRTSKEIPWEEYKEKAKKIKEECIKKLPQLIIKFKEEAEKAGAMVYFAPTANEALNQVEKILREKKARNIVKSKSMVSEEIKLNEFLEKKGYRVVETDLGEWIIQLAGEKPSHITAPALHKTKEEIAQLLSLHLQQKIPSEPKEIVKIARQTLREDFIKAEAGISGANFAIAESGTLVLISNEGNARLVTSLPPVHIALVTVEKFVETLEQAVTLIKTLTVASSGMKLTSYVSFITGPSRTSDIEKQVIKGVHGPEEVHIIILDNARLSLIKDKNYNKILYCLKCGGCMLVCPVFQAIGGHVYGGPVYPGGIGILITSLISSKKTSTLKLDLCADCKKCEKFCPVQIPIGELILSLKEEKRAQLGERLLSSFFRFKRIQELSIKAFIFLEKSWKKNAIFKKMPFPWIRGKTLPALSLKERLPPQKKNKEKIYLFEGCLVKIFFPEIRESVRSVFENLDLTLIEAEEQTCCGAPSYHLRLIKHTKDLAKGNIASFEKHNPEFIITICPTGNSMLKKIYPRIISSASAWVSKIFDFTEFIVKKGYLKKLAIYAQQDEKKVFYHYPCHYLNQLGLEEEPEIILKSLRFLPVKEEEPLTCCGFCGVFSFKNPEISANLWEKKKKKILETEIKLIASDCPGCLFQFKSSLNKGYQVFHTAELVDMSIKKTEEKREKNQSSKTLSG